MKTRRFFISIFLFVVLVIVILVATARRTQEANFDEFVNQDQEISHVDEISREVSFSLPRLPENKDHFETTPESVRVNAPTVSSSLDSGIEPSKLKQIIQSVPFTSQAPSGRWIDARFQDGCEEASALMAIRWVQGKTLTLQEAEKGILSISEYERKIFGSFHDTSARDTVERIFRGYFKYENVEARFDITTQDIQNELVKGNLVIVPVNGQKLGNPYYTPPGPDHHMLVVIGYDPATDEFITNDPGTRRGKGFRYSASALERALQDYPTGNHKPAIQGETAMIVVGK